MRIKPSYWPLLTVLILILFLAIGLLQDPRVLPSALLTKQAPHFALPTLDGQQTIVSEQELVESFTLINIWASWCLPCREEHNFLLKLRKHYPNLRIIGINYKDDPLMARSFLKAMGNPYSKVAVDRQGTMGFDWGVYGVPESFLVDAKGRIVHRHAGKLDKNVWHKVFQQYV